MFVTRIKHVLVARARDQAWSPAQTPNDKISGILARWPIPDKEFFGYLRLLPSFSVSERTVSMDSHSF